MDTITAATLAGFVGAIIGAVVTYVWRFNEKQQQHIPHVESLVPAGADAVLSVLSSSAVIIDTSDTVVKASAPAYRLGLIHGDRLVPDELMDLVRTVRRDGQVREGEFTLATARSSMPLHVSARVAPVTSRLVVCLVDDRTRERRVEAIRRDFVANVSHELKTPIGAINLLAEAVAEAKDDPDAIERFSARMLGESERLTRLVQQIIDLSRLQGDRYVDEPASISVARVVAAARDHSSTDAETKGIVLVHDAPPDLFVLGDPGQIESAVSNLVENAVTYSPPASRVAIAVRAVAGSIEITVTDQGIGIPAPEQDRIFERFYRVDPARHRSTGGTGLGLSIVKHVAASHGGTVRVWSEPGQGSSFTLVLPTHTPSPENALDPGVIRDTSTRR